MLAPSLATMLVVITTDAEISAPDLQTCLQKATALTFDRIDSDGCMSTNDTVLAPRFAVATAEVYRGVSSEELACLRDGFAALTTEEKQALYRSGLTPGTMTGVSVPDVAAECGLTPGRRTT